MGPATTEAPRIVGESPCWREILAMVERVAPTPATVLLLGESGTGKELLARALHRASGRQGAFVAVHCAALPEGLLESELFGHERGAFTGATQRHSGRFELAAGGTLFLDEIGELPLSTQVKLLRVVQTREYERVGGSQTLRSDARIVAATHKDLVAEIAAGRFREDLYYRLNVVTVAVPPLRAHPDDIPRLATHFLRTYAQAYDKQIEEVAPAALAILRMWRWPGNVRELQNAIESAVALGRGPRIEVADLPDSITHARPGGALIPGSTLREIERDAIVRTLEMVGGSTSKAARVLGVSTRRIQYRLKEMAAERAAEASSPDPGAQT